jgi:hypothetical protein
MYVVQICPDAPQISQIPDQNWEFETWHEVCR